MTIIKTRTYFHLVNEKRQIVYSSTDYTKVLSKKIAGMS